MTRKNITAHDCERLRLAICRDRGVDPQDPYGPRVIENWDWLDHPIRWAIVWEGDYEWPLAEQWRENIPPHMSLEAATGFALGIYPS
jgi:hypothetical protein